jgi:hypothetical protein
MVDPVDNISARWILDDSRPDLVENWFMFMADNTRRLAEQAETEAFSPRRPGEDSPAQKAKINEELHSCARENVVVMQHALRMRKDRGDSETLIEQCRRHVSDAAHMIMRIGLVRIAHMQRSASDRPAGESAASSARDAPPRATA